MAEHPFPFANQYGALRPYLPINGKWLRIWGLIDTGADSCSIPAYLAEKLGHDLHKGNIN